ncbi:non-ribosomal peptide synthetase [Clostridium felsineum]|uniref:non-ribosomal peptide synthetase n=1 Tax=Clostridium felsineum TaxID=36839 RepID=UPI00098C00A9|nr:non-ribosomal peptide synthetase [Clostridium felsineum]URZ18501.1 Gramicidin S synthase 2 [Clostridium felsineum DSM 794]
MNTNIERFEITHPQKRIWYNELLFQGTYMHNIVFKISMGGNLNIEALEKAINIIIEKNDALRLKFYQDDGELYQYLEEYEFIKIPFLDFSKYGSDSESNLNKFLEVESRENLYNENKLLFKFFIYKINDYDMGVCFFVHHLIFDGRSCNILLKELVEVYDNKDKGISKNSYIDFIKYEKNYLISKEFQENKNFWKEKFLNLNKNSVCINFKDVKAKVKTVTLNRCISEELKRYLNKNNISLNKFFIALSSIYMSRVLRDNDISLAVLVFNRAESQRNTMGMFTGTMPLRLKLKDDMTFEGFLKYLKGELKECYHNQKYPYDLLVQDLELKKKGVASLFKFCVNYYEIESYEFKGKKISNEIFPQEHIDIPMQIFIKDLKEDIQIQIQYGVSNYTEQQITEMLKGMSTIYRQVLKNSKLKISALEIVHEKERNLIIKKFNNTRRPYEKDKTVKELFEKTAQVYRDKIALVSGKDKLSYRELNERANKLARFLIKKGIKIGNIVPIICDSSVDAIIGMLAIIKSGAAYLPIDDSYPSARINYMLKDSGSKLILLKENQMKKACLDNIELVNLKDKEILKESSENLKIINTPGDLSYVIYTSGSTGNPKGVCVENRNLVKLVNNPDYVEIKEEDRVLQSGSLSFDASVFQIWIALLNGLSFHIEDKDLIINSSDLKKYINDNKITMMVMPTPLFNQYSDSDIEVFQGLKWLMVGGDVLLKSHASKIKKIYKNLKLINAYGPTENTVISTTYEVKEDLAEGAVPIGKPISNSTAYVMDNNNKLLPIGAEGELYVGGDGISRGYLNRKDLTNERFIENPYVKGEIIYKTGDLARWLEDGNLDFLGRIDYQVKINGFRIELQEIEAKLLKCNKIKEAVVVDKKDKDKNKYLCAYVVVRQEISQKEIKALLKEEIPAYMIPPYIIELEGLPKNANGKVDRKALPEPNLLQRNKKIIKPRYELEKKLYSIWCECFNKQEVSIDDNFFELGGNSLKAINLVSKTYKNLKIKISIMELFHKASIQELAEFLKSKTKSELTSVIKKVEERDYYEASAVQKRMYAINQRNLNSTNYNIPIAYLIKGDFSKEHFEKAICELINRHEALRTSFCIIDGKIVQKIHSKVKFKISYSKIDSKFCKSKLQLEKYITPFDLSKAPLIRAGIIEFTDASILIIDVHHIVFDGISLSIITKELSVLYNGNQLDKVRIQYKDFSNWQNKSYEKDLFKKEEKYWLNKFQGEIPSLNMPVDYKNADYNSFNGASIDFEIDRALIRKVNKTAVDLGVTKFMVYIAVFNVLLYKYTNGRDIVIGTPSSGRTLEDVKDTVGMFVNTLPLRNELEKHMNFREFLIMVKENSIEAFENQNYDLKNLLEKLKLDKGSIFDVVFSFQDIGIENLEFNNTQVDSYKLKSTIAKFPMYMTLNEDKNRILGQVEYQTSLYKKSTIENFIKHYINLLNNLLNNMDDSIEAFDVLSEEEKYLIINKFNNTKRAYEKDKTVRELFEKIAERYKDKIALVSGKDKLSYKELNEKANKLARFLIKKGIKRGDIVPIICDSSVDTIIAMLAIIKSGAAYLPIDDSYPSARINYMLKDSRSKLILLKESQIVKVSLEDIELVNLKDEEILKESSENLEIINTPEDLSYVIYTSGSTGNPKGVCVENRNLVKLVNNPDYVEIKEEDRVLQSGSLSFDASVFQIWIALLNGLSFHLEDKNLILNGSALENYIEQNKITIMLMPTPLFNQYSESNIKVFRKLNYLLVGGDVLCKRYVSKITRAYKNLKLINIYGPTENTVISTAYEVKENLAEGEVPIGKPISNSTAYIMDDNDNLLPVGVPGELCVGGAGISSGYLNRKDLTKKKFIENPYVKGEIIYKTGDLARWLEDGNLDFLGRIDYQVKINGFRIELQEIEAKLLKCEKIKEAVVVDKKDKTGNKYLCAYVVEREKISPKEIKTFLKKELPAYMIPSYIVELYSLPKNANGKVDRKALPNVDLLETSKEIIKPRYELEKKLHSIWCEIFIKKEISIDDNFFELGGNSLKAINLVSKIHKKLKLKIAVMDVFDNPSIEELAEFLKFKTKSEVTSELKKAEKREYYEASAVQKRMYAINQRNLNSTNYNIPIAYLIRGDFNKERFEKAICKLIDRHEALRTSFCIIDGKITQKVHSKVEFRVHYSKINSKFCKDKFQSEKYITPFDLSKAPLIGASIIEFIDASILIIDVHHIVSDGISIKIIINELSALYNGVQLSKVKIQYKDFSNWQNNLYKNGKLKKEERYWLHRFQGEIPNLNMPVEYKKSDYNSFNGASIDFEIDRALIRRVNKTTIDLGVTKFMFYIAVFNVLLYKYTNERDIVIGTPGSGRTNEDVKDTIGMFVNTLPLRSKLETHMSFKEFLIKVKENSIKAFENQNYDLKNLFEQLKIDKGSLFNVIFSFQDIGIENLTLENTQVEKYKLKSKKAKFPISMILNEGKDRILGQVEYQTSLYKRSTIERFIGHYINLLNKFLNNLDKSIEEVDVLSEEEKNLIINKFNNTKRSYKKGETVKELFEKTAKKWKNKTALVSNGKSLTYGELNERANKLARFLIKKGTKKEDIVPILCDRSIDAIISMLAIIKSGAAYLPIDDTYPSTRINYMLKDSCSKLLLLKENQKEKLHLDNIELVNLRNKEILKESSENLKNINTPKDLAYVIYTSGSTGNPKGVCVKNRSLVKLVNNPDYIEIKEEDRVLQSGSLSFDASVFQIWIALLNGLSFHLEDKNLILNSNSLENYIEKNKITIMLMPTPLFNQYSESNIEVFKKLKCLLVGGDVLSKIYATKITKAYKNLKLINTYGPTENSVISTAYEVKEALAEGPVPIGKPISNSTAYVMDENNNLLPVGVPGELCVGGAGISRGYLNRQDLTKKKFIENPYVKGEIIYKTGDLARWLEDGNLDFLGRIDYQVKINGFRIELQEIEAKLLKCEKIKEAVVVDRKDKEGNKYLCAYVVKRENISSKEIKIFLRDEIPVYMIPPYIIELKEMPMSANGKVDRKALMNLELSKLKSEYTKPKNTIEEKVSGVWSNVLGVKNISTDLNFFEVGGNSLKAISVVSALKKEFIVDINDIFKYPTIQALARNIKIKALYMKEVKGEVAAEINRKENNIAKAYNEYKANIENYNKLNLNKETGYKNILLTGATGYVGVNLLKELICSSKSNIYLLLRGDSTKKAEERIIEKTSFYFGKEFYLNNKNRIKILKGDISKGNLGLEDKTYESLASKVDCIINSAANVKHYGRYEAFYSTNVLGTKNLLAFARKTLRKDFNQISTLSVGSGSIKDKTLVMFSEDALDVNQQCDNVYVRSKLEAEELVKEAGEKGLNTKIFRLGNVMFNHETGLFQENIVESAFYRIIRAFIKLKCVPFTEEMNFDFSYVDELSKAVVLLFNKQSLNNCIFHIENPNKINPKELVKYLRVKYNDIELKDIDEFIKYSSSKSEDENLKGYAQDVMVHLGLMENNNSTQFIIVSDRTNAILEKMGFRWSILDYEEIKKMLSYCERVKFI